MRVDRNVIWRRRPDLNNLRLADRGPAQSLIDVTAMTDGDNHNEQNFVIDVVKDSIVANPESVPLTSPERP
jgi:hypothetical protein